MDELEFHIAQNEALSKILANAESPLLKLIKVIGKINGDMLKILAGFGGKEIQDISTELLHRTAFDLLDVKELDRANMREKARVNKLFNDRLDSLSSTQLSFLISQLNGRLAIRECDRILLEKSLD